MNSMGDMPMSGRRQKSRQKEYNNLQLEYRIGLGII
jgi:hypothetical protein